jgi:hypothetical protein
MVKAINRSFRIDGDISALRKPRMSLADACIVRG